MLLEKRDGGGAGPAEVSTEGSGAGTGQPSPTDGRTEQGMLASEGVKQDEVRHTGGGQNGDVARSLGASEDGQDGRWAPRESRGDAWTSRGSP